MSTPNEDRPPLAFNLEFLSVVSRGGSALFGDSVEGFDPGFGKEKTFGFLDAGEFLPKTLNPLLD